LTRIGIVPKVHGVGGMVSFREKLAAGLQKRGVEVSDAPDDHCDALLVIAGTRDLGQLRRARKHGIRVVHRLDGINWLHRKHRTPPGLFIRAETGNLLLAFIRRFYADRVVYQSEFIKSWWEDWYGRTRVPNRVIYNGVDLGRYSPSGPGERPTDSYHAGRRQPDPWAGSRLVLGGLSGREAQRVAASTGRVGCRGGGG
jgi:glycosyltransferase involved in cell wall biosynthesis